MSGREVSQIQEKENNSFRDIKSCQFRLVCIVIDLLNRRSKTCCKNSSVRYSPENGSPRFPLQKRSRLPLIIADRNVKLWRIYINFVKKICVYVFFKHNDWSSNPITFYMCIEVIHVFLIKENLQGWNIWSITCVFLIKQPLQGWNI